MKCERWGSRCSVLPLTEKNVREFICSYGAWIPNHKDFLSAGYSSEVANAPTFKEAFLIAFGLREISNG